jgi:serine phosphatase RsbU (regulator of sigma subunit)/Tfp pilus assembly protein PilF
MSGIKEGYYFDILISYRQTFKVKAYYFLIVFLYFMSPNLYSQDQKVADSLSMIYQTKTLTDTAKLDLLRKLSFNEVRDLNLSLKYAEELISLAIKTGSNKFLGSGYFLKGNKKRLFGDLEEALDAYIKSAEVARLDNNMKGEGNAYGAIADIYSISKNHPNARLYYKKAIAILRESKDSVALASAILNAGDDYMSNQIYDTAYMNFTLSKIIFEKLNYLPGIAYNLGNIGMVYANTGKPNLAEKNIEEAIKILEDLEDYYPICVYLISMADIYIEKGDKLTALKYSMRSLNLAQQHGLKEQISDANLKLSELYEKAGEMGESFKFYKDHIAYRDSVNNIKSIQKLADLRTEFEVKNKQEEVNVLKKNKKAQLIMILSLLLILLMALGLIMLYYYSLKRSRILSAALDERNILLEKQSAELKEQNDKIIKTNEELKRLFEITSIQKEEIISSINYAQRMQSALLPPRAYITELLNENFILYKPKDIVSGDFYWIKQVKHHIILVSADCTGHGVPAAFMSVLGISYLNEIVQRREITQANQVLNELRKEIKHSLRQTGNKEESRDGIDMALCVIDTKKNVIQYSGAYRPLYLISQNNGEPIFKEFKADLMPVGVHFYGDKSFTNHEIPIEIGDTIYLSSDGFIDQMGGPHKTKFSSKNFKKLLLDIYDQPMYEQKEILEQTLKTWIGDNPQRDDILVIGARI